MYKGRGLGGGLSTPASSHAANFFGLATYFSFLYGRYKWWFFTATCLVGLSRISVGVHYPLDVVGGAVLGVLCAVVIIQVHQLVEDRSK